MPDATTKKRRYTFNYGRLKLFVVIGVLIYTLAALAGQQETLTEQIERQEELTRSQAELEQRVEYYTSELDYIGTDEYVEQEARTRFGWLRPGEIKYVEGSGAGASVPSAASAAVSAAQSSGPAGSSTPAASRGAVAGSQAPTASSASGQGAAGSSEPSAAVSPDPEASGSAAAETTGTED